MLLTTTDLKVEYEVLGIAKGSRVKAAHVGRDILAALKNLVGGEVKEYADLLTSVRDSAVEDMVNEAKTMGLRLLTGWPRFWFTAPR